MTGRYVGFWASLLMASIGCADEVPGTRPRGDQLFYPTALVFAPGRVASEDRLLVSNSNFDQRYNASTVTALSVDELFRLSAGLKKDAPLLDMPVESFKRIPSLSGEIYFVANSSSSADGRVFVTSRGENRLTMVRLQNGTLDCGHDGVEPMLGLDCTAGHVIDSGGSDPYALSYVPSTKGSGFIATAHLRLTDRPREEIRPDVGIITFADLDLFQQRLEDEQAGNALSNPLLNVTVPSLSGVSGLAIGKQESSSAKSDLLVVDLNRVGGAVSVWEIDETGTVLNVRSKLKISLGADVNTSSTRGLVMTASGDRGYISVRFTEPGGAFNAGIAVLVRESGTYRINNIYEFGVELGRPTLRETEDGKRLLYAGDIRTDRIWILDVTTDAPRVVGELTGRETAQIDLEGPRLRILDGPSSIVFVERQNQTLGFVSNFSNSTLAVLDVSDLDPRKHKVVGRLGRVIEPDGTDEEDNE